MENEIRMTIRYVPKSVASALDQIVKREGYTSRNDLILRILTDYVALEDNLMLRRIPAYLSIKLEEIIKDHDLKYAALVQSNLQQLQENNAILSQLLDQDLV